MATKKTGLGRGLDALLGPINPKPVPVNTDNAQPSGAPPPDSDKGASSVDSAGTASAPARVQPAPATAGRTAAAPGLRTLGLDQLKPGKYQPRRDMHRETLQELADSIRSQGVLSPISVRPVVATSDGAPAYEIIAGERRWRAAQLAGISDIPVIVRDVSDEQAAAIALIENLQREDLNALEEAEGLRRLIEEFDLTHLEAATAVGKSRAAVTNLIRVLDLASDALQLLAKGELSMGHARALLALSGSRSQAEAAHEVVARGLSVRQTEALVKKWQSGGADRTSKPSAAGRLDPDIRRLQDDLSVRLGARVAIQHGRGGKGKLVINYNSVDELDGILKHIK